MGEYTTHELGKIISLHSKLNGYQLSWPVCFTLGSRCKGNPRTGVMLMRKIAALCRYRNYIPTVSVVNEVLEELGVDYLGFTSLDRQYLNCLEIGPKSKHTLGVSLQLDNQALSRVEGYLIKTGLVIITSRGRALA